MDMADWRQIDEWLISWSSWVWEWTLNMFHQFSALCREELGKKTEMVFLWWHLWWRQFPLFFPTWNYIRQVHSIILRKCPEEASCFARYAIPVPCDRKSKLWFFPLHAGLILRAQINDTHRNKLYCLCWTLPSLGQENRNVSFRSFSTDWISAARIPFLWRNSVAEGNSISHWTLSRIATGHKLLLFLFHYCFPQNGVAGK